MKNDNSLLNVAIETFENKFYPLRQWQRDALSRIAGMSDGQAMLCDATCGAGKSTVQALHIDYSMRLRENKGEHGIYLIASPRLFLNEQLYCGIEEKIPDFKNRCKVYNFSSGDILVATDANGKDDKKSCILLKDAAFGCCGRNNINKILEKRHVLIVACFTSLNNDLDATKRNADSESMIMKLFSACKAADRALDVVVIDEVHKGFKSKTFTVLKNNTRNLTLYSATPTKFIDRNSDVRISYSFHDALSDGVVVRPRLYELATKNGGGAIDKAVKCGCVMSAFEHLLSSEGVGKRKVLCVFDNTVDHLNEYRDKIMNQYGNKVDVAVYASKKNVVKKNRFGVAVSRVPLDLNFNGVLAKSKKDLREKQDASKKPLVILSAYMLQEGIDMPYINGVLILGEKTDNNLYQAICRGDRVNKKDRTKKHFNVYVPSYLCGSTDDFLFNLIEDFDDEMDFGSGEEKATGQSQKQNPDELEALPVVAAMLMRHKECIVRMRSAYDEKHLAENAWKRVFAEAKKVLDNGGTRGKAMAVENKYVHTLIAKPNYLEHLKELTEFCENYKI